MNNLLTRHCLCVCQPQALSLVSFTQGDVVLGSRSPPYCCSLPAPCLFSRQNCSRKREEDEAREAKKESKFGRYRRFAHGGHEEAGTRSTGQRHGAPKYVTLRGMYPVSMYW